MSNATSSNEAMTEQPSSKIKTSQKGMMWTGRVLTGIAVLFLLFDAFGKFTMPSYVVDACTRLGIPVSQGVSIGALLLVSTIIYVIPRTAVLGAVLLTGFLGGAVAIQMRAGSSTFETVFPVIFGIIVWAGIYLRDCKLRAVFPVHG
jgi:hypothetical protein